MFTEILIWTTTIIGACAVIGKALIPVVKLTKTKKDDSILAKINKAIATIKNLIDKIGLNK